jgi:hypothetical protein
MVARAMMLPKQFVRCDEQVSECHDLRIAAAYIKIELRTHVYRGNASK